MQYIGKMNNDIYNYITDVKIVTNEVIITEERIKHIIERRGQSFYDKYRQYFGEIIINPDYVFKDKMKNTVIISKCFIEDNTAVNLVIKLAIAGDNNRYKNSVITAIKENSKRFKQRLRNNEPVYKRIDER